MLFRSRHVPNNDTAVEYYGYRPDSPDLWNTVKLEELIAMVDLSCAPYHVETHIAMATRKADHVVEAAVDSLKTKRPDKFTGDTWHHIQNRRNNRFGRLNGHRFQYE